MKHNSHLKQLRNISGLDYFLLGKNIDMPKKQFNIIQKPIMNYIRKHAPKGYDIVTSTTPKSKINEIVNRKSRIVAKQTGQDINSVKRRLQNELNMGSMHIPEFKILSLKTPFSELHEMGHAIDFKRHYKSDYNKLLKSHFKYRTVGNNLKSILGTAGLLSLLPRKTRKLAPFLLGGAYLSKVLAKYPTLRDEWKASAFAKKTAPNVSPEYAKRQNKVLNRAYTTYLKSALVPNIVKYI